MKIRLLLIGFLCIAAFNVLLTKSPLFSRTKNGVIVFTDPVFAGTTNAAKPEVVSGNITRLTASPPAAITERNSLKTAYAFDPNLKWGVQEHKEKPY